MSSEIPEFEKELAALLSAENKALAISASKISTLTKLALKYHKFYKHIVHAVEKFCGKSGPELKLGCVYIIDSICRACRKEKDEKFVTFVGRFESRLAAIFEILSQQKIPSKDKDKIKRVASLWAKNQIFTLAAVQSLREKYADYVGELVGEDGEPLVAGESQQKQLPDTASLVATLAQINPSTQTSGLFSIQNEDPLAFDYGEDSDGEAGPSSSAKKKESDRRDSLAPNNSSSLPESLAVLLGNPVNLIPAKISSVPAINVNTAQNNSSSNPTSQPQTPMQGMFTFQHQQQLASLLAAQGLSVLPPTAAANSLTSLTLPVGLGQVGNAPASQNQQQLPFASLQDQLPSEYSGIKNEAACDDRSKKFDSSIEIDQLKILTRTLYVGGISPAVTEDMLKNLFAPYQPESIGLYHEKAHAFIKLKTRECAERAKRDFWNSKTELMGEPLRLNWACGVGRKDTFDRRQGYSIARATELSETEKRWYYVELGLDFLREHTAYLLDLKGNSSQIQRPFHLGGIVLEEPENLSLKRTQDQSGQDEQRQFSSSHSQQQQDSPRKRQNYGGSSSGGNYHQQQPSHHGYRERESGGRGDQRGGRDNYGGGSGSRRRESNGGYNQQPYAHQPYPQQQQPHYPPYPYPAQPQQPPLQQHYQSGHNYNNPGQQQQGYPQQYHSQQQQPYQNEYQDNRRR